MDKNQFVGLILIFILLLGYTFFSAPSKEELAESQRQRDSLENIQEDAPVQKEIDTSTLVKEEVQPPQNDSIRRQLLNTKLGLFASAGQYPEQSFNLENDLMKISLSNKGARVTGIEMKNFKKLERVEGSKREERPLYLMEDEKNRFEYILPVSSAPNGTVSTNDIVFNSSEENNSITFTTTTVEGGKLQQTYSIQPGSYKVDYDITFIDLDRIVDNTKPIKLNWVNHLDKLEENSNFERNYTSVYYQTVEDSDSDYCSCTGDDNQELNEKVSWISHVNQFFNSTLIAKDKPFDKAIVSTEVQEPTSDDLKILRTEIDIPYNGGSEETYAMQFYFGPNEYDRLKAFDNNLEEVIAFGRSIFGTINRWIIRPCFDFLVRYIGSKGMVIIVLIFIIKMLLYPLTYKMLHSQAKMQALKPKLSHLTEKFKEEPQKKQMESMKIYREYGVSPLGGCMPMVLQMPIWYALFRFFPASITFRQESFLWAHDLSSFDEITRLPFEIPMFGAHISLFTVLWAITTVIYTYYNTKHMDMSANPAMKYVQYFMPIMFLVFFNNYASGLTCYMFFSNIFNILQTVITKKYVFDEQKIQAELEVRKSKPKKKSGFQARLEEAMKQQQAQKKNKK